MHIKSKQLNEEHMKIVIVSGCILDCPVRQLQFLDKNNHFIEFAFLDEGDYRESGKKKIRTYQKIKTTCDWKKKYDLSNSRLISISFKADGCIFSDKSDIEAIHIYDDCDIYMVPINQLRTAIMDSEDELH